MLDEKSLALWNFLVEYEIATDDEIGLVTAICGQNIQSLENILFIRTGYHSMEQYINSEWGEE